MLKVNILKQAAIEAAANIQAQETALNSLLDSQAAARATYRALLKRQADGDIKTDDDRRKVSEAEAVAEGFEARLSAQRKLVAEAKRAGADADRALSAEQERLAAEDAQLAASPSGRIRAGAPNADADPKRGFRDHRDFLSAVQRAGSGQVVEERLRPLATLGSDEAQTASNPYGGFLVPSGVAPGLLAVRPKGDPLAAYIRNVPLFAPKVTFNARVDKNHSTSVSGGLIVTRHPETIEGTGSRMQFEQVEMNANEEAGFAFATERLISDSPQSFVALLSSGFGDEYAANAMKERILGSGVGERQGALNTPCLITVSAEATQVAATIVKENIDKMAARCWDYSNAVYLANHTVRPQLRSLYQVVGIGGVTVPYFSQSSGQEYLDGRPIFFTEFAKALGTVGDLILGVWSEYLEGSYQSERSDESIHVRYMALERTFRFYRRNDGQWWWRSALTPANGDTLSPAVVLATRA